MMTKLEDLEQYGRRTSLRFHNVPMKPTDLNRTDTLVLGIINEQLKVPPLTHDDINRSHIIGEINQGKGQIICRFRNWKVKNLVYQSRKFLRGNVNNTFITEDLTQHRQSIIKELNKRKKAREIHAFWTFDGRIFAKKSEGSTKKLVKSIEDINELE